MGKSIEAAIAMYPEHGPRFFIHKEDELLAFVFPTPTNYLGFTRSDATELRDRLNEFIEEGK